MDGPAESRDSVIDDFKVAAVGGGRSDSLRLP